MPREPLWNCDRLVIYAKQRMNISLYELAGRSTPWPKFTPKQLRRAKKKSRKNNDKSIGVPNA